MSMEFANRICPNCNNPNYMVLLGDFSKAYKYKCMNCNRYFNDVDFEKEPLQPVWKSKCMNTKVDMVEVVRCKDCVYGMMFKNVKDEQRFECVSPTNNGTYVEAHDPGWFCADGERKEGR